MASKKASSKDLVPNIGRELISTAPFEINLADPTPKVEGIRLNIGSGTDYKPKFLNIDRFDPSADANWDIAHLPLCDSSVAQIICYSVLEHIPQNEILPILKEWHRVLKKDGCAYIMVPDMVAACQRFIDDPEDNWSLARIYGHQANEGQFHKSGFTPKKLFEYLGSAGFQYTGMSYYDEANGVKHLFAETKK